MTDHYSVNHKSSLGLRPAITAAPPNLPDGSEWWCSPPTAPPDPAHLDYAVQYLALITNTKVAKGDGGKKEILTQHVARWVREARKLLEQRRAFEEGRRADDDMSTDELLLQSQRTMSALFSMMDDFGYGHRLTPEMRTTMRVLARRGGEIMRRRLANPAHPVRRVSAPSESRSRVSPPPAGPPRPMNRAPEPLVRRRA